MERLPLLAWALLLKNRDLRTCAKKTLGDSLYLRCIFQKSFSLPLQNSDAFLMAFALQSRLASCSLSVMASV